MSKTATEKYITVRKLFEGYFVKNITLIIPVPKNLLQAVTREYQLNPGMKSKYKNETDITRLMIYPVIGAIGRSY